jgi:hypothetical protein
VPVSVAKIPERWRFPLKAGGKSAIIEGEKFPLCGGRKKEQISYGRKRDQRHQKVF